MMATTLALTFQSSYMYDGLAEFYTMIRGCNLIGDSCGAMDKESVFHAFRFEGHVKTMQRRLQDVPTIVIDGVLLDHTAVSLESFRSLCTGPSEKGYFDQMLSVVNAAYNEPMEGTFLG